MWSPFCEVYSPNAEKSNGIKKNMRNIKEIMVLCDRYMKDEFPEEQKRYIALQIIDMFKTGDLQEILNILQEAKEK
jgi:hypothetical protein